MVPGAASAITPTAGGAGGEVMGTGKFGRGGPQIRAVGGEELQLPAVRRKSVLTLPTFNRIDNSPGEPLASPQEVQNVQAQMKGLWRPSDALRDGVEDKSARRDELERQRSILQRAQGRYEGAWLDKVDMKPGESAAYALKRVEAELAETDRELAGQHWNYYAADNEEQLARLARQPESGTLYERAGTAGAPDVVIGRVLSALQNGGAPEGDTAAVAQIRERFGVSPEKSGSTARYMNDLTALLGTDLETRDVQTEAIGELKRRGYNYSRISGYERTRKEAEEYARKMEERQEAAREHPVLSSAASVLASPLQGLDFLDAALRSMGPNSDEKDLSGYVPLDPYAMEATNLVRTLRGTVAEEIEKNTGWEIAGQNAASFLYQTGMSVADSAAQIAAFGPAATYFMGAGAASNQAQDIMARGGTNRQVLLGGLAAGAAEAVFEKFSIDHLLSAKTVGSAKDLLRETLKQAGVEAGEETFTEIANILSDAAIMGGSSGFHLAVRDYMAQGMSGKEARRRAYLDLVGQVAWAGAGGALSGGIMGGAVNTKNYISQGGVLPGGGRPLSQPQADSFPSGGALDGGPSSDRFAATFPQGKALDGGQQKTASMGEAVGYTPMEADAIRYEGKTFRNIIAGIDSSVSAFFDKWRSGRKGKPDAKLEKLYLGKMDGETAAKVGDILGYEIGARDLIVTNDGVKHIMDTHGDAEGEIRKGNAPLTAAIIDALPDVVAHPDVVRPGNIEKSSPYRQGVIFEKMLPDGTAVYIQFDNSGRGTFEGRTLYVKEKESSSSGVNISEETHTSTSKTTEPELSSDTIIPQEGQGVKGKDARMAGAVFLPGAADTQTEGRQKTASTGEAGTYRAATPQNVELPTVPVINLSMQTVADMNGGVMPKAGNYIRKAALEKTQARLGLDKNPAAYIEASNVTRNGDAYVIKITKSSLNKMLSASSYPERVVPLESIAVLSQLERIAQNGVYFSSEGDRRGRAQIAGYDHLMTTVYIDGVPYLVDMRVRVEDEKAGGGNRLYHFTPETIEVTKKNDGAASTAGRHATSVRSTDTAPSSDPTITQDGPGVKGKDARMAGAVFLPGAADTQTEGRQKTASTGEAGTYRAATPQNVELPTVPVINLSLDEVAQLNGGTLPRDGGHIRDTVIERARERLGLDRHSAAFIPASNVFRNGEEYVLKITKATLNKMFSVADGGPVPIESAAIMEHLERIANNGVYFKSEGDRKGRPQINGIDHLMTTVYIDGTPTLVDMRVRLVQQEKAGPTENVLYYFSPETITLTPKKGDGNTPAAERQAFRGEASPSPMDTIPRAGPGVKGKDARMAGAVFLPGSGLDAGGVGPYNGAKEAVGYGREEGAAELRGVYGSDVRGEAQGVDAGGESPYQETGGGISEKRPAADWSKGHIVEQPLNQASVRAGERASSYIPDVYTVEDAALKKRSPGALAITSDGVIHLSDAIPEPLADAIGYHEVVHAVKQRGSAEYHAFLEDIGGRINPLRDKADEVLGVILRSRFGGKDLLDLSAGELKTAYDELSAVVWGFHKADPENARAKFAEVFTDYEGYIAELDAIMEGARGAYAEGGRTPPGGEGAALDAGERRALEEGWRDEEPGVRAAGPYNGAKEAGGYGRGEEALTGLQGVPGADVRGGNPGADAGGAGARQETLGRVSETVQGTKSIPGWAEGHVVENPQNPAAIRGAELAGVCIPDTIVVEDSALKQLNPGALAMTSGGTICLSDAIEADMVDTVSYHEVVHAVKQRGSTEYKAFLGDMGDKVDFLSPSIERVMGVVLKSRYNGKSMFDLTLSEMETAFDELNALVWGHFKADPEHARAEFGGVFTDYDGYIAELDATMEGARGAYAEGGRTPPGGEGAALDAGERRALEEGWRDEEPGVRAAGPYNGAKEAGGYGRGEEALTGLQGVPGADVRGGNPGADATDAGIPRGGGSENGGIQEAPGRGGGAGARLPAWAQGHVAENPPNPAAIRGTERAGRRIWRSVRAGGLFGISYCLQGRYVPRRI